MTGLNVDSLFGKDQAPVRRTDAVTSYTWDADDPCGVVRALSEHIEKNRGNIVSNSVAGNNNLNSSRLYEPEDERYDAAYAHVG